MSATYVTDFNVWLQHTAQLLRERRWHDIDVEHLAEEIEDVSKSERRGIASQLTRLLLHVLKWQYQPQRRSDSWLDSITDARVQIDLALKDSPSLHAYSLEQLEQSYQRARHHAVNHTGISLSVFPHQCPYALETILDDDWLPEQQEPR